ncbi:MAG: SMP-30/gluconolactonase/LRE family protein [Armatimonadetes bacterium]|nr:SMP-30/gluconolactonase/LRE family protein [Armatimonadota bacterium]
MKQRAILTGLLTGLLAGAAAAQAPLETVHDFYGPMPTGVTVSHTGRIFVCYPHWGDPVKFTVGEIKNGREVPYPNAQINRLNKAHPAQCLYSVQSVVVDPRDRLWALDTGSIKLGRNVPGGAKLVGIDLKTTTVFKTIFFPRNVALPYTYLNDIRFDLRRGRAGLAYITDSGAGGLIMVDLASGRSWRHLSASPTVRPDPGFSAIVNGQPLLERRPGNKPKVPKFYSDGLAISSDGKTIYYCPVASHHLYSVSAAALANPTMSEDKVAATVKDLGRKVVSDGLETDAQGNVYVTDEEHHGIKRRSLAGKYATITTTPHAYDWMDTMSVATDGYLYVTANQLEQQGTYHYGKDLRVKPYTLYRVRINRKPVLLK